jgi:hypothetical protein
MAFDYPSYKSEATSIEMQDTTPLYEPCQMENDVFQHGEEVVYKLYYNWNFVWLAAGEVTFRVRDLGDKYHLSAHGRTYKSYEWFFKVRDKYDTYVDKETLLPIISIRDVAEGKYRLFDQVTFDKRRNKAISNRGKSRQVAKITEYDIDACMHDILSIIYYTRNIDFNQLSSGSEIPIKIFMDKETWPLKVKYRGKEVKKIRNQGKHNTIKFTPEVIVGTVFNEDTQMMVWASDDKNKIPLLIESPVSVGSVKVVLKSYKGLKYDFDAALK